MNVRIEVTLKCLPSDPHWSQMRTAAHALTDDHDSVRVFPAPEDPRVMVAEFTMDDRSKWKHRGDIGYRFAEFMPDRGHHEVTFLRKPLATSRLAVASPREQQTVYTLTIVCRMGTYLRDECARVVEMTDDSSLYDLHDVIQDAVAFGRDHPFEFFRGNSEWPHRREWLTAVREWEDKEEDFQNIRLKDIWPLGRRKLYYWFGFGDDWIFEIRKSARTKAPEPGVKYPRLIESIGPNPEQYPQAEA